MRTSLLVFAWSIATASAQLNVGVPGVSALETSFNGSHFCNQSFADANATGTWSWNPDVSNTDTNLTYMGTVYQPPRGTGNDGVTELSLWFSPGLLNFTDNYRLGYDACYLWIQQLSLNTFERGQSDDGSCLQTFDETCVGELLDLTTQFSGELVNMPSPGPNSNLTRDSLPDVCSSLAAMLTRSFPPSCKIYTNQSAPAVVFGGPPGLGGALTGPESLVSRSQCKTNDGFSLLWTEYGENSYINYLYANYFVAPIITAFMPIADVNRPVTLADIKSFITCHRPDVLNPDSEKLPNPPSPTPVVDPYANEANSSSNSSEPIPASQSAGSAGNANTRNGISGGAIGGIVVGVILGLALIAALLIFFFRRRKSVNAAPELDGEGARYGQLDDKPSVEAPYYNSISEMASTRGTPVELAVGKEVEMQELSGQRRSGPTNAQLVELPAATR